LTNVSKQSAEELNQALGVAISTGTTSIALESSFQPSIDKVHFLPAKGAVSIPRESLPTDLNTCLGTGNVQESTADLWREMEVLLRAGHEPLAVLQTCTTNPARKFGLQKGALEPGMDADFVLFRHDKSLKQLMLTAPVQTPLVASFVSGTPLWMESEFAQSWQAANIAVYATSGVAPVDMDASCEFDSIESALADFGA